MKLELALEKLWARVEVTGFCWLWTGETGGGGYGRLHFQGARGQAHRIIYELLVGPIPDGLQLDHLCRIRNCVNPDHVEPVTFKVNQERKVAKWAKPKQPTQAAIRKAKGLCQKGHVLAVVGVLTSTRGTSIRKQCRACQHDAQERWRRKAGIPEQGRYFKLNELTGATSEPILTA